MQTYGDMFGSVRSPVKSGVQSVRGPPGKVPLGPRLKGQDHGASRGGGSPDIDLFSEELNNASHEDRRIREIHLILIIY